MKETMYLIDGAFPEGSPEEEGISSRDIAAYIDALRAMDYDLHSLQIVRHGKRVFAKATEPYTLQSPHRLLSAAKSIIAAAVLFVIDDGKLRFEDKVADFFSEYLPDNPCKEVLQLTVYDLLTMQTGQDTDDAFMHFLTHPDEDLCRAFFVTPFTGQPGTHFFYNNAVPHLLFTLVERATGRKYAEYLNEKLCSPLGIRITAQYNNVGIYDPVTTVVSAEDFMKLGVWFLQEGAWEGKQLLDPSLIRMAMAQQVCTNSEDIVSRGYGMQIWRNFFGGACMNGGGVQLAMIVPEQDMVFTITSNETRGHEAIMLAYEKVISRVRGRAMLADPEGERLLQQAAATMNRAPVGQAEISGCRQWEGKYRFAANDYGLETMSFHRADAKYMLCINNTQVEIGLYGVWKPAEKHILVKPDLSIQNRIYETDPQHCMFSGGWQAENRFVFTLKSLGSMGEYRFCLTFDQQRATLQIPRHVSVGAQDETNVDILSANRQIPC